MTRSRDIKALATAGALVAAFGSGVVPVGAQDPESAPPADEVGRTAPQPEPQPSPPATEGNPGPAEDDAPPVLDPAGEADDAPESTGGADQGDVVAAEPTVAADKPASEEEADAAKPAGPACTPLVLLEAMSEAERESFYERHPDCRPADDPRRTRTPAGLPTAVNPTVSLAVPGPAPVGVPNFFIEKFRIPPFLLPIYQAAGIEYGIRWEILAAINEIETDYGRNLNVSSAGALGWMQFMPATWKAYGTDANGDDKRDPYNPVDAIFAAARYLKAAGADEDLRRAIFAYNHADWYVESVLLRARLIGGMPADLIGSLTGLTQGHFPVYARARYADDLGEEETQRKVRKGRNAAVPVNSKAGRRGINIYANPGSPVIAVQDGTITKIGMSKRLGRFVALRDSYGNTYTYARLGSIERTYPKVRENARLGDERTEADGQGDTVPVEAASAGTQDPAAVAGPPLPTPDVVEPTAGDEAVTGEAAADAGIAKERLFAAPERPAAYDSGGDIQLGADAGEPGLADGNALLDLRPEDVVRRRLKVGSRVVAGTLLGSVGRRTRKTASHLRFEIRPAGRGAPRVDPKPILDGWKLLESTAIYRANQRNPLLESTGATVGQVLLMSKEQLRNRVLSNPRIDLYPCGRQDVRTGVIDRRILATLEVLASSGLRPTVTSLRCGHSVYTASGNISHHSSGNAVDIAKVNGIPILGHQGDGSITDMTIRRLLTLQGTMRPAQIISLMTYDGADNTLALPDHADHIHVGFHPAAQDAKGRRGGDVILKPVQWTTLVERLGQIENPKVLESPSKYAVPVPKVDRASDAHRGE